MSRDQSKLSVSRKVPWFDPVQSFNPAVHRVKQALFHAAVVPDLASHPLPPPHPDLLYYLEAPEKVVEKARPALKACKKIFNVKAGVYHVPPTKAQRLRCNCSCR